MDRINFTDLLELLAYLDGRGLVVTDQDEVEAALRRWYEDFEA